VPPAYLVNLPDRGEMFFRHHRGDARAPTLVLIHGWTACADVQWFTSYRALQDGYSFLAVDVRGHGRGLRSEETFSLEDAADDIGELLLQLGVRDVILVGYSMGGPLSLLTAHRHRGLVAGMVLCATALDFRSPADRVQWVFLRVIESLFRSRTWAWVGRRSLRRLERRRPDLAPFLPWIGAELHRADPVALADGARALRDYDASPFAGSLGLPAAVLVTTKDRQVRPEKQVALAAELDAPTAEVAGDHFACWGEATEFARTLRHLVDDVAGRLGGVVSPLGQEEPARRAVP
jgi:3-oxoadipate enol-lactonase